VLMCVESCDLPEFPSSSFIGVLQYGEGSNRQLDIFMTAQGVFNRTLRRYR
jgi:hypothetical protein